MSTPLALAVDAGPQAFPAAAELCSWLDALGLQGLVPGRCSRAPDARSLRDALPGIRVPAVRGLFAVDAGLSAHELCLTHPEQARRQQSLDAVLASARQAATLGASWLVLDLLDPVPTGAVEETGDLVPEGLMSRTPEQELDLLCRVLHRVLQQGLPVGIALATPSTSGATATLETLGFVLEDLARHPLRYWHDPGRAHARQHEGLEPAGEWLHRLGPRCVGADLTDAMGAVAGLPAGAGEVDWAALREALPSAAIRVVRSEPFLGPAPLAEAVRHLRGLGL